MNFKTVIPICYWPSTVVIIDDEAIFLQSAQDILEEHSFVKSFTNPEEGIIFINKAKPKNLLKDFLSNEPDDDNDAITNMVEDTSKLHLLGYDHKRFDLITVVVMDYNLPKQKGLYYIRKMQDILLQKILLTGYAKPDAVIEAFNEKLIDKYIGKYDENSTEKLMDEVNVLKSDYFEKLTLMHLHPDTKLFTLLTNAKFIKFFNTLITNNKVTEFYLLDPMGSFLLVNAEGAMTILALTNDESLEGLDMLFDECTELSPELIDAIIHKKTKMPFFIGIAPDLKQWPSYIHDCYRIKGTDMLYALISDIEIYAIKPIKPCAKAFLP